MVALSFKAGAATGTERRWQPSQTTLFPTSAINNPTSANAPSNDYVNIVNFAGNLRCASLLSCCVQQTATLATNRFPTDHQSC